MRDTDGFTKKNSWMLEPILDLEKRGFKRKEKKRKAILEKEREEEECHKKQQNENNQGFCCHVHATER